MDGAELAGRLIGLVLFLTIPIAMVVVGRRRKTASAGRKGGMLFVAGIVLLVLVVLSLLAQAGQVNQV
ncbi:MAG: hypothetical protein EON53_11945 [Actinomycetales bacterium]|nr:MAG: hypothetical protein EON53_11945 [Actinomycetales bacterium]